MEAMTTEEDTPTTITARTLLQVHEMMLEFTF